jgi:hypothetical protein
LTLHDLIAGAVDRRLPPSLQLRAALQAALRQAQAEGYVGGEEAARAAAILAQNPHVRREVAQREAVALSVEFGLQLGATYDAEQDTWTPPVGMTGEAFLAAISERLQAEAHHQLVTALTLGVGHLQRAAQLRRVDRPLTAVIAALATADAALLAALALAETPMASLLRDPASWEALSEEPLVLPWSAFQVAHPSAATRLADQLAAAQAAAEAMRRVTAADAPLAEVLAALRKCLMALARVRQVVAG